MRIVTKFSNKYLFKCKLSPTVLCDFFVQRKKEVMHILGGGGGGCFNVQEFWSKIQRLLKDNNLEIDLTYHRISFGILDENNIKT